MTGNSRYILNMAEDVTILGNSNPKLIIRIINIYLNDAMQAYIMEMEMAVFDILPITLFISWAPDDR